MLSETMRRRRTADASGAGWCAPILSDAGRIWAVRENAFEALLAGFGAAAPGAIAATNRTQLTTGGDYAVAGRTAIIEVRGLLSKHGLELWGWRFGSSYMEIERQISRAVASEHIRNIVLKISSPGGSVFGSGEAADAIFESRKSGKRIVAFVDGIGTSAAYRLASQADRVVLGRKDAMTGSIGTYAIIGDWSRFYESMGVVFHRIRAGEKKGIGAHGIAISPEELSELQREVDMVNRFFIDDVARGRERSQVSIRAVADGAMRFANDAINSGLADEIRPWPALLVNLNAESPQEVEQRKQREAKLRAEEDRQRRAAACGFYKTVGKGRIKVPLTANELDEAGIEY